MIDKLKLLYGQKIKLHKCGVYYFDNKSGGISILLKNGDILGIDGYYIKDKIIDIVVANNIHNRYIALINISNREIRITEQKMFLHYKNYWITFGLCEIIIYDNELKLVANHYIKELICGVDYVKVIDSNKLLIVANDGELTKFRWVFNTATYELESK